MKQRSFPAVVIAFLLLLVCYYPGQRWLAPLLPGISGHATLDAGLTIFDIPVLSPFAIDLILVPALFVILYSVTILALSSGLPRWEVLGRRLKGLAISLLLILGCVAVGGLLSSLLRGYLPAEVRKSITSLAVVANLHLPAAGSPAIPFQGDAFSFVGLVVALIISLKIITKPIRVPRRFQLTREQLMTPYQRMLLERRNSGPASQPQRRNEPPRPAPDTTPVLKLNSIPATHHRYEPSHRLCRKEPLVTLQPEAVNFRPLG